jgi:pimeloyl-ACP methyl ester carboxylesterase
MKQKIRKLVALMALAIVLAMGFVGSEVSAAYTYSASPTSTTNGGSSWGTAYLKLSVSVSGSQASFKVTKIDGGAFTNDGTFYLKVGTQDASGATHDEKTVLAADSKSEIVLTDNLDEWPSAASSADYYVRDEVSDPPNPPGSRWVWVGPITITRQAADQPADVNFNYTETLSWKDYKQTTYNHKVTAKDNWYYTTCEFNWEHGEYSHYIPFEQNVSLTRSASNCKSDSTSYEKGDGNSVLFSTNQNLLWEGDLILYIDAKSPKRCDGTKCNVYISATFYDETPTTDQQKILGTQSASIPVIRGKQELKRIPVPMTQFTPQYVREENEAKCSQYTSECLSSLPSMIPDSFCSNCPFRVEVSDDIQYGHVRDFECKVTADESDDVAVWCERQDDEFVIYAYTKAAIDGPVAPFASIASVRSSGKKVEDGVEVIKAVKWKDDEFDEKHDMIEFVGQAADVDGSVVEYLWEADGQFLSDKLSFSYTDLKLGRHFISFKAKDDSGLWSIVSTKIVDVVKPPILLVHGFHDTEKIWENAKGLLEDSYPLKSINISPNNERISYGAEKVSKAVKELREEYGVPKVDILAYSLGGLNARWYIQSPGYRNDVNKLVMIATPNHGSTLAIFINPDESGVHKNVYTISKDIAVAIASAIWAPLGEWVEDGFEFLSQTGPLWGPAAIDLIPGSPALRNLNGNKKDEGFKGDERADNIRTVYGNSVQYFTIYSTGWPSITHSHLDMELLGYHIYNYDIVFPTLSLDTDLVVSKPSSKLDGVPGHTVDGIWHFGMHSHSSAIEKARFYLGDDPPESDQLADSETDISKILAVHPIFAPENGGYSTITADQIEEQSFEVEAGIKNFSVMLMPPAKEGDVNLLSLRLITPSGELIDEYTDSPDVKYDPQTMVYQIFNAEAGEWTAEIESASTEPLKYALLVMGETDFWIGVREEAQTEPGEPIEITAYAQKEGKPASGLYVTASVLRTFDEGERIGSKYGQDLADAEPEEIELTDLGDGRYEMSYNDTLESGIYRVFINAEDPETGVSRMAFTTFFVEYSYDFSVQSEDISFSKNSPESNETITVYADVHNNTPVEAKGVEVIFSDGSLNEDGKVFGKTVIDLPANGSTAASFAWRIPAGQHDVFVIVSPMNTFIEDDIQNNIASKTIATPDKPPTANAGGERISRFNVGKSTNFPIVLDAGGSVDDLGIENYEWDMNTKIDSNGDSIPDNDVDFTGVRAVIPEGSYAAEGDYQIKLTVTDSNGQKSSDTITIHLKDAYDFEPPVANAGNTQTLPVGDSVKFDASASSDNFGIVAYLWDIDVNSDSDGDGIQDNDADFIGMKPVLDSGYLTKGIHTAKLTVSDAAGNLASSTVNIITSDFTAGIFIVGETGIIKFDWLYDGGMYKGELGIFSLKGMENLTPGSPEFIAEAVRRVLSGSTEGHIVLSDPAEGARFSGSLGEPKDWNSGEYKGVKSFEMTPGDSFATILVPNSTFAALAANPGTSDSNKRPLFSLVSPNPAYGMYMGQIADVNGMGTAFSYEDISADTSDRDYNDLIIQVFGATVQDIPSMDSLKGTTARSRRDSSDWRTDTELGRTIMAHLDAQTVQPETVWLSADINFPADIAVYSPDEKEFGTKGGHIPGATFGTDIDGYRFVKLPSLENGGYRIVLRSADEQSGLLTLRKHWGQDEVLSESGETVTLEAYGSMMADVSVSDSGDEADIEISGAAECLRYDFNCSDGIDDSDINRISSLWNTECGDPEYDPFFDLDGDCYIGILDIMPVANEKSVQ